MTVEIPLSSKKYPGLVALIDDEDAEMVSAYKWYPVFPNKHIKIPYAMASITRQDGSRSGLYMHRLIMPDVEGQVDHVDRNALNNTRANLRAATASQNSANRGLSPRNKSGYIGVDHRYGNRWRSMARIDGNYCHLGTFDTAKEAAIVRDTVARIFFGEFASLNFPDVVMPVSLLPQMALKHIRARLDEIISERVVSTMSEELRDALMNYIDELFETTLSDEEYKALEAVEEFVRDYDKKEAA